MINSFKKPCVLKMIQLLGIVVLSGCSTLEVSNFQGDPASGAAIGSVRLYLPTAQKSESVTGTLSQILQDPDTATVFPGLSSQIASQCNASKTEVAPFLLSVIPVLGKLGFDLFMEKKIRDVDALKEASQGTYSARTTISALALREAVIRNDCFVLVRTEDGKIIPNFVAVLRLDAIADGSQSTAFSFTPVYVMARNGVAVTKQSNEPKMSVAIAITLKSIAKQDNGLPILAPFGEAAVSLAAVSIGKNATAKCSTARCATSEPLPLIIAGNAPVVVAVAVSEKGNIGIVFDTATNELVAIKEALGPVIGEVIKAKLEK